MKKSILLTLLLLSTSCTINDFLGTSMEEERREAELSKRCYKMGYKLDRRQHRCTEAGKEALKLQEKKDRMNSLIESKCGAIKEAEAYYECEKKISRDYQTFINYEPKGYE